MPSNLRIHYAVESVCISKCGENSFTAVHGLQSAGMTTKFNLEQVFEIGQLEIYENIENLPEVEMNLEKVLDGYPLIYHLLTKGATSGSLAGRSNARGTVGLSIYTDTQDSASGAALAQCKTSGVYVSSLAYNFQVQGNSTESVGVAGNNRTWLQSFTSPAFNNTDSPLALSGSGGVNRREDVLLGESAGVKCKLPLEIPGVSASGYLPYNTTTQQYAAHLQSIKVSTNLGRENLFELGRRGPYHRYATFPVEVKCDIEIISTQGDGVEAVEESSTNTFERTIYIATLEGTKIDLGTKNRLASVSHGGANAGQNGGNVTNTFSYINFNSMLVSHPQDPAGL